MQTTTPPLATPSPAGLTPQQVRQFHEDGYLGPIAAFTEEQIAEMKPQIEKILETDAPDHTVRHHNRHLEHRVIWDLATPDSVVNKMRSVVGDDLIMWRTNFFTKKPTPDPTGREIPWHQDANYWPLEPEIVISAWMAIDPSTIENSCVNVIPGSHRKILPHVPARPDMAFKEMADVSGIDLSKKVPIEMKAGEFMLFNERTLHQSDPNRSDHRRLGFAIRVILPQVRVLEPDSPNHRMIQIHGEDRMGFNEMISPPPPR